MVACFQTHWFTIIKQRCRTNIDHLSLQFRTKQTSCQYKLTVCFPNRVHKHPTTPCNTAYFMSLTLHMAILYKAKPIQIVSILSSMQLTHSVYIATIPNTLVSRRWSRKWKGGGGWVVKTRESIHWSLNLMNQKLMCTSSLSLINTLQYGDKNDIDRW